MKKVSSALLCGIAAIVITIILYFVILGNIFLEAIHLITLIAIILAEAATTAYAFFSKGAPRKVAAAVVSAVLIPYAVILSVVYIINFPDGYVNYLLWYFGGAVIVNALALILTSFDSGKQAEDARFQAARNHILEMRKIVKCIMADPAARSYEKRLRALEEKLHFTNDGVFFSEDADIRATLVQIQENIADPEFDADALLTKAEKAIDRRTIMTSRNV